MKFKLLSALVLIFFVSLIPAIGRTYYRVCDAHSLIILALTPENELSMNPYDGNGVLLDQDGAVFILKNFEYPYDKCLSYIGQCDISLISWAGRGITYTNSSVSEKGYDLIRYFVKRGESLEVINQGLPLVHEAILYNNHEYLGLLLSLGANPNSKAEHEGESYHNMTPLEFIGLLESRSRYDHSKVKSVLLEYL